MQYFFSRSVRKCKYTSALVEPFTLAILLFTVRTKIESLRTRGMSVSSCITGWAVSSNCDSSSRLSRLNGFSSPKCPSARSHLLEITQRRRTGVSSVCRYLPSRLRGRTSHKLDRHPVLGLFPYCPCLLPVMKCGLLVIINQHQTTNLATVLIHFPLLYLPFPRHFLRNFVDSPVFLE